MKTFRKDHEVQTPYYEQTLRLKALLALIDRSQDPQTDLEMLQAIGITKGNIQALLTHGFVTYSASSVSTKESLDDETDDGIAAWQNQAIANHSNHKISQSYAHATRSRETSAFADSSTSLCIREERLNESAERLMALYALFNDLIRPTFGLRGVMLQLQLERCAMLDDYREVAIDILKGVRKAKGDAAASELQFRIDTILGLIAP